MKQMSSNFQLELQNKTSEVLKLLEEYLPSTEIDGKAAYQKTVIEAMNYSFQAGGKRLRPLIMQETYKAFGGNDDVIKPFMAALEMIHTYSLVHDDLPEMDNDELRRGMPTTHIKYGAGMAVLAGDGLLNYAYETALKAFNYANGFGDYTRIVSALEVLGAKAGIYGMVGGQTLDVEAEEKELDLDLEGIHFINENKTAALLEAAFEIGGILAGADVTQVKQLENIGSNLGIAFQLQDDILDVTSSTEILGKPVGSDVRNNKRTYIAIEGLEKTISEQKRLSKMAVEGIESLQEVLPNKESCNFLKELIISLVDREK